MLRALYESLGVKWENNLPWQFGRLRDELQALHYGAGLLDFSEYGLVELKGTDRHDFLHNQCTSEIKKMPTHTGLETLFLNNRGQIEHTGVVMNLGEAFLILSPTAKRLAERFRRYIVFDAVEVSEPEDRTVLRLHGHGAEGVAATLGEIPGTWGVSSVANTLLARDEWGIWLLPLLEEAEAVARKLLDAGAVPVGRQAWNVWRVENGIPGLEEAFGELPQEVGWENRVNFKKGCYLGQEIMARLEARGNTRYTLMGLLGQRELRPGAEVFREGKNVGKVGTAVESPEWGAVALGVLRKELQRGDQVDIEGWSATVTTLPLDPL